MIAMTEANDKRPLLIKILAILSFIWMGYTILGLSADLLRGPISDDEMLDIELDMVQEKNSLRQASDGNATFMIGEVDKVVNYLQVRRANHNLATSLDLLTYLIGLTGVIFMVRRRVLGFHLYIIYSLLAIATVYLYATPQSIPVTLTLGSTFSGGLFVLLYSRNLRWMKSAG